MMGAAAPWHGHPPCFTRHFSPVRLLKHGDAIYRACLPESIAEPNGAEISPFPLRRFPLSVRPFEVQNAGRALDCGGIRAERESTHLSPFPITPLPHAPHSPPSSVERWLLPRTGFSRHAKRSALRPIFFSSIPTPGLSAPPLWRVEGSHAILVCSMNARRRRWSNTSIASTPLS